MAESDRFRSYVRNLRKQRGSGDPEALRSRLEEAFTRCMAAHPSTLVYDLFYYWTGEFGRRIENVEDLLQVSDRLLRVVELFEMDLDDREEPFTESEWLFIRESVSDAAVEMDQRALTYVMQQIVARNLLDQPGEGGGPEAAPK